MEISVLHSTSGDYSAAFDLDEELARKQCEDFIRDCLHKGYALFLEQDGETHRITGYDPNARTFTLEVRAERGGKARIEVKDEREASKSQEVAPRTSHRKAGRVTAVAPSAGG